MKRALLTAAIAAAAIRGAAARAAEIPGYELEGLPITPHQVAVLGPAHIREQPVVPLLTVREMPASPSQIAILTPHQRMTSMIAHPSAIGPTSE